MALPRDVAHTSCGSKSSLRVAYSPTDVAEVEMGTLSPNTKCFYCGVAPAQSLPDGSLGPICVAGLDQWVAGEFEKHEALLWKQWQHLRWPRSAATFGATSSTSCRMLDRVLARIPTLPQHIAPYIVTHDCKLWP